MKIIAYLSFLFFCPEIYSNVSIVESGNLGQQKNKYLTLNPDQLDRLSVKDLDELEEMEMKKRKRLKHARKLLGETSVDAFSEYVTQ